MKVRWSPEAKEDLQSIYRHIARDSSNSAAATALRLVEGIESLRTFPQRGRTSRIFGSRELVFAPLPYIAVYRIVGDVVDVSRIFHAAQDWP